MAVVNPGIFDNGDDEDGPITFKRASSSSKNRPAPPKQESSSASVVSVRSPKAVPLTPQRNGVTIASRLLHQKPHVASPNPRSSGSGQPNSSTERRVKNNTTDKGPLKRLHESDDSDDDKPISFRKKNEERKLKRVDTGDGRANGSDDDNKPLSLKMSSSKVTPSSANAVVLQKTIAKIGQPGDSDDDNKPLSRKMSSSKVTTDRSNVVVLEKATAKIEQPNDSDDDKPDDSDDDNKPLSRKMSSSKVTPDRSNVVVLEKTTAKIEQSDDSDDDKPLLARFPSNAAQKNGGNVSDDSEDEKPLAARFPKFTGSASASTPKPKDKLPSTNLKPGSSNKGLSNEANASRNLSKRPLNDNNQASSSVKKAKPSGASPSASGKVTNQAIVKRESKADGNDDMPLSQRAQIVRFSNSKPSTKNVVKKSPSSSKKDVKKMKLKMKKTLKGSQFSKKMKVPPGSDGGQKWTTLEHSGVIFPPPYKPHGVKMLYNGQPVDLTPEQEEVATMFAVMKDTEYAAKKTFINNFFNDWRKILGKNHVIKKFELCDFTPIYEWHLREKEKKKQMTSEEKKALKEEKLKQEEKYMWAIVDGVKEKVGNFRVEPPGLFRGRGEHPKMGKLKRRIRPSDITINIGRGAPIPECPIPGESWKEVKHDNAVTWLAFWNDPISQKDFKYVFLAPSSKLKGLSDREKYEKARKLKDHIHKIRENYTKDFRSKDATKRQIAVATYLIDKLALRAGNEKDDDEADTVGCCTLKVDNVTCLPPNKLQFDFLGKDSIRYFNTVEVEPLVYKAIEEFRTGKAGSGDLFDELDTTRLNTHLKDLMHGLTAKVFRTYNASITLDEILHKETEDGTVLEKVAVYQRANKEVAIICNHQRTVSKSHESQMSRLNEKIDELKAQRDETRVELSKAKKGKALGKDKDGKKKKNLAPEALEKKLSQIEAKIEKMEMDKKIKEDLKTVALGTSKINYLDPRISVAWCKRHEVPIEKIFNKSLLAKFSWAMDVDPDFRF